jgi:beta-aspartyl-peptidase (threonine type)
MPHTALKHPKPLSPLSSMNPHGLAIHGGAGAILRANMTREVENAYRSKLKEALDSGYAILDRGGPALDAVIAAVSILEDSPLFNAGHGAVLNAEGFCEMDAAVMDGSTLAAGSVAGLQHIVNPIRLARTVMQRSPHVMLMGEGAEKFALKEGFKLVANAHFQTDRRRRELEVAQRLEETDPGEGAQQALQELIDPDTFVSSDAVREHKWGTVGCVALDKAGNLAAGTSTGGLTNKRFGRVGDSPIIGAGTYANNATCAVSCTGTGEYFIRAVAAHEISSQMEYGKRTLAESAEATLAKIVRLGGSGGLVAIDREGHVALPFSTPGMYRGFRLSTGQGWVDLYGDTSAPLI